MCNNSEEDESKDIRQIVIIILQVFNKHILLMK